MERELAIDSVWIGRNINDINILDEIPRLLSIPKRDIVAPSDRFWRSAYPNGKRCWVDPATWTMVSPGHAFKWLRDFYDIPAPITSALKGILVRDDLAILSELEHQKT